MGIEIIRGNLLNAFEDGEVNVIGHVVNCVGAFNAGIAKQIRNKYPEVYSIYKQYCDTEYSTPICNLGTILDVSVAYNSSNLPCKQIYNLFAQLNYGTHKRQLNYGAMGRCLEKMSEAVSSDAKIGFPYLLGCGLSGGSEEIILEMIEFYFKNYDVRIYKLGN
jgi:O-acetyl-ADP-ribose deacetylase (regulator of RNase III)